MSDTEGDYEVGPGKPPLHTRFKKGQSGNPLGRHAQNLPALLVAALNQPVAVTENGRRRQVAKREAVIASAGRQIRHRRFACHQDAARHPEGHRKTGRDGTDDQASPVHCGRRGGDRKPRGQAAARLGAGSHHTDTESTGWLIEANSITENEAFFANCIICPPRRRLWGGEPTLRCCLSDDAFAPETDRGHSTPRRRLLGKRHPEPRARVHPVRLKLSRRQADDRLLRLQFTIIIARGNLRPCRGQSYVPVFGLLLPDRT
jgi:hypothetical protein